MRSVKSIPKINDTNELTSHDGDMIPIIALMGGVMLVLFMIGMGWVSEVDADYPDQDCIDLINEERIVLEETPDLTWRTDAWFVEKWWSYKGCSSYFDDPQLALDEFELHETLIIKDGRR